MDSQIYFHQYRRPRVSNPTYSSSNVQNSMTFFRGGYYPEPQTVKEPNRSYFMEGNSNKVRAGKPMPLVESYRHPVQMSSSIPNEKMFQESSKMANYGQRSLQLDQVGVYHKQTAPYNIINLKPKQYPSDIRQYPRYSLENRDDVFYKKMNDEVKEKQFYSSRAKTHEKTSSAGGQFIAGKHTYGLEQKISMNPEQKPAQQNFTAKMLNHMDELQHNLA